MAHILLDETEIEVAEDAEGALNRIVNARDGLRRGNGAIVAPPGWVSLTAADGSDIYVQVARIAYVREDSDPRALGRLDRGDREHDVAAGEAQVLV
jgi:hypothetical protein